MKAGARPVKPKDLGIIGRDHLLRRFVAAGAQEDSFDYQVNAFEHDAFKPFPALGFRRDFLRARSTLAEEEDLSGWEAAEAESEREAKGRDRVRRMVTGLNFSPSVGANPFRELRDRQRLDGLLNARYAGPDEPVIVFVHLTTPRLQFLDKGKSSVALS